MTSLLRTVAYLIFAAGLMGSVATTWLTSNIVGESGFVDNAATIGANEQVQQTVINVASAQLAAKIPLGPAISSQVSTLTNKALTAAVDTPEFEAAWAESMRRTHRVQFTQDPAPETLTVDLAPFVDLAINQNRLLSNLGVKAPESVLVDVGDIQVARYVNLVSTAADLRILLIAATAVAGIVALLTSAKRKRGSSLAMLGTLTVAVTVLSAFAARITATQAVDQVLTSHREWAGVVRPIGEIAIESIDSMLMPVGAAGLAIAAAGVIWRAISARQR